MKCLMQKGWKECRIARKLEIKAWQKIANFVKNTITELLKKYKDDENIFGPLIYGIAFISLLYSLTGIASMFYNK